MTDMIKIVEKLSQKAAEAPNPIDALQFSQAAQNVSHALMSVLGAKREFGGKDRTQCGIPNIVLLSDGQEAED